jgi:hypothetical protein
MTESLSQPNLPWASIYTLSEPEGVERTIHGIVYVWTEDRSLYANAGRSLLRIGDTRMPLWCHSLLNPFLLMTLLPTLKAAYPALSASHWAMLMGNGQAKQQQALLEEIITIGQLDPGKLQADMGVGSAHHPAGQQGCMGLHVAAELYRKALGSDTQPAHALLLELLAYLLNRDDFSESTEYCPLPTLALSAVEIAQLYHALILPLPRDLIRQCPDELTECLECWNEIAGLMREHPASMGGPDGLDTHWMTEFSHQSPSIPLIAKVDPHGLLCMGIGPNARFADGLGIYIQLAPDFVADSMQTIANTLLHQLGLLTVPENLAQASPNLRFHFDLQSSVLPT